MLPQSTQSQDNLILVHPENSWQYRTKYENGDEKFDR
jgi:hypothetical protein